MGKLCCIIGAGDITNTTINIPDCAFIISADGGYQYLADLGIIPDLAMGDFDSLGETPDFENKVVLPCEKDFTDMKTAVDEGLKRGYNEFAVFGALGGERADHSVANIALLSYICSKGATGRLIHNGKVFLGFSDGKITLPQKAKYRQGANRQRISNGASVSFLLRRTFKHVKCKGYDALRLKRIFYHFSGGAYLQS
jgi:thiamine pyrophosphokinase